MKKTSETSVNSTSADFLGFQLEGLEQLKSSDQYTADGWYRKEEHEDDESVKDDIRTGKDGK